MVGHTDPEGHFERDAKGNLFVVIDKVKTEKPKVEKPLTAREKKALVAAEKKAAKEAEEETKDIEE